MSWWEGGGGGGVAQRLDKRIRSQISPCISYRVVRGTSPGENQECRKSHLRSFCNAIKISNLPELCLFADVSEQKVPIYSILLNVFEVDRASLVGCAYHLVSRRSQVRSSHPAHSFVEIWSWKKSTSILSLPLFKKGSCQLLAKECALSTGKLPRRLAQEVWIVLTDRARNGLKCVEGP